ncbi:VOC family protein [Alkalicoccus daliensis]|uniref:Lactoylglutathione lyase n=1 Tax=Alkalicoccus daliensis TaxID=745820 RepID=A0A1H0I0F4_9BACI|nr:VOC family protein [Alkalicoccus daliensis]SDO24839.1 lactoylglutathione lyase [Alkalicoccus daliensis]
MINGIAHTAFTVADMKKSLYFYCEVLGLEHAFQVKKENGEPWIEYVKVAPKQYIELFHGGKTSHTPAADEIGPHHFCLLVDNVEEVAAELKKKGLALTVEPKRGLGKNEQCWINDPDGNKIEFLQPDSDSPHNQ